MSGITDDDILKVAMTNMTRSEKLILPTIIWVILVGSLNIHHD